MGCIARHLADQHHITVRIATAFRNRQPKPIESIRRTRERRQAIQSINAELPMPRGRLTALIDATQIAPIQKDRWHIAPVQQSRLPRASNKLHIAALAFALPMIGIAKPDRMPLRTQRVM